jgi:hypothetical protein
VIWGSPSLCLVIPRGFQPLSSSNPVSTEFVLVQDIFPGVLHTIYDFFQTLKCIAISFGPSTPSMTWIV